MRKLTKEEQCEINGGGLLAGAAVVTVVGVCGAVGYYNGKKDTDQGYDD
ncbi:MAG: class IIb bacteriocin, lactobin A/cerein 7B family [Bacillota bacterium]